MLKGPVAIVIAIYCLCDCYASTPSITVPGIGTITGKRSESARDVSLFLNIPYAKPPTGQLRWKSPQAHGAWSSPRDGTKYGNVCRGATFDRPGGPELSEDCLSLNIAARTARMNETEKQPVLVWLYGGAYDNGDADSYAPGAMVGAAELPVIVVTLNYRMNMFGFLGSSDLAKRNGGSTGNFGIEDQRLALQWVQQHIGAFGGDGGDITVFGQSAGGNSVLHHLTQPASYSLFQKAIIESGTYQSGYPLEDAEHIYQQIMQQAGCADVDCMVNMSTADVEAAKNTVFNSSSLSTLHWGPVWDNVTTVASPQELITAGKFNTKFSNIILNDKINYPEKMTEAQFDHLLGYLGEANLKTVKQVYDPSVYPYPSNLGSYSQWWWMAIRVGTDHGIPFKGYPNGCAFGHCSARSVAADFVRGGAPSVNMYLFARPIIGHWVGHASEIPFVFHMSPALVSPGNLKLSSTMVAYWTSFATSGSPNSAGVPNWPAFAPDGNKTSVRLDATFLSANITLDHDLRGRACDFWDSL